MFFSFPLNQLSKTSVLLCSSSTPSLVSSCSLSYLILCLLGVSARCREPAAKVQLCLKKTESEVRFRLSHFKWERFVHPHQRDTAFLFDFISYKCQRGNNGPDSCMANCWALISLAEQGVQLKSFHSGSFQSPWCSECLTADANLKNMRFLFRCISQRSKGGCG